MSRIFSGILSSTLVFSLFGCYTARSYKDSLVNTGNTCEESLTASAKKTDIGALNLLREMYYRRCYREVIKGVEFARYKFREPLVSISRDAAELVTFEGTFIDYTLESYERTYLSLLSARSYMQIEKPEDAKVELRRAYEESVAKLETQGQDRVTLLLLASIWDQLNEPKEAEPIYKRVVELSGKQDDSIYKIALTRIKAGRPSPVYIYELGYMPLLQKDLGRKINFRYPVTITYKDNQRLEDYISNMIPPCKEGSTYVFGTQDWLKFLTDRYYFNDNPKTAAKKMARLPSTILYSTTVFIAGSYLTFLAAKSGTADGIKAAAVFAVATPALTVDTFEKGMAPDLRYWDGLPQAIVISNQEVDPATLKCVKPFENEPWLLPRRFL